MSEINYHIISHKNRIPLDIEIGDRPEDFVIEWGFDIVRNIDSKPEKIGYVEGFTLDETFATNHGFDILYEADAHSVDAHEVSVLVYDYEERLRPELNLESWGNAIYFQVGYIIPSERGQGLLLRAMWHILEHSSAVVALVKPFPLQHQPHPDPEWELPPKTDFDEQREHLVRYFDRFGFEPYPEVEEGIFSSDFYKQFMFMDLLVKNNPCSFDELPLIREVGQ